MPATLQTVDNRRPWNGPCATTGRTMDDFAESLAGLEPMPDAIKRAAVSICRAYGIKGWSDPGYIANVIAGELARAQIIPCTMPNGHDDHHGCRSA